MGVLNHFPERRWWDTKTVSKMGYEIFSNCAKLSSALVPRIKSDRSLSGVENEVLRKAVNFFSSSSPKL